MSGIDVAELTPRELQVYAAAYLAALEDASDRCRRNTEAITDLEQQLADARADADYWHRIANPTRTPTGPTHTQLQQQRRQLAATTATPVAATWAGIPVRVPPTSEGA